MNGVDRLARKLVLEESLLDFTRYTFKARFGFPFVLNDHHYTICNELQDLVNGKSVRPVMGR